MKDLKHYFTSPRESETPLSHTQAHLSHSNDDTLNNESEEIFSEILSKIEGKKKKRKRKTIENEEYCPGDDSPVSIFGAKRTRKNSKRSSKILRAEDSNCTSSICAEAPCDQHEVAVERKSLRKAKLKSDSDSSKENTLIVSDAGENELLTLEPVKNLFNYFNKVDKLPNIEENLKVMKVVAMVHPSPEEELCKRALVPRKKRKSKSKKINVDYNLITVETILECNPEVATFELEKQIEISTGNSSTQQVLKTCSVPSEEENTISVPSLNGEKIILIEVKQNVHTKPLTENDVILIENENVKPKFNREDETMTLNDIEQHNQTEALHESDVIFVEEYENDKPKSKRDGTLASFFKFGNKLSTVTKNIKHDSLPNGISQPAKKFKTSQPSFEDSAAPFPKHSHILQTDKLNILWNLSPVIFKFRQNNSAIRSLEVPPWSSIIQRPIPLQKRNVEDSKPFESKAALKLLKKELNLYPIACWYKELKAMRKKSNSDKEMWCELYRPHVSDHFISNSRSLSQLKTWLTELKESSVSDGSESSSEEFKLDDDNDEKPKKTAALLFGPSGTGKTAGVYAVAEEIGYSVIEINASCNRSGKKILNDFSEAMKSHKVGTSKINFCKVKKKKENPQRSLLLVEDADLLFEDDDGFVPTLATLDSGSKRPLILVANSSTVRHLAKLSHLFHIILEFVRPHHDRLEGWLRTLSIVEGAVLPKNEAYTLSLSQDIRRCLLQLQLFKCDISKGMDEKEKTRRCWERCGQYDLSDGRTREAAISTLDTLVCLDLVTRATCDDDPCRPYWKKSPQPTTLTIEDTATYTPILEGLTEYLLSPLFTDQQSLPRKLCKVAEEEVDPGMLCLRRSAAALDLWPALRGLARAEQARLATHTKRNTRYFNYLSSVGVKGPSSLLEALSSTFS